MTSVWDPSTNTVQVDAEATIRTQRFIATSQQVQFSLTEFSYVPNTGSTLVTYNGAVQTLPDDYVEESNTSIRLKFACNAGDIVDVIGLVAVSAVVQDVQLFNSRTVATAGQTNIPVAASYRAGTSSTAIYRNGLRLAPAVDYLEVDEASYVTLTTPAVAGQVYFAVVGQLVNDIGSEAELVTWSPPQQVFSIPNRNVKQGLESGIYNIRWDSRFKQDRVTDNTAAIAEAIENAYAEGCALYVPAAAPGYYASVEGGILIQNKDNFILRGDGTQSLFLNTSIVGENLITVDASTHTLIAGLGLTGVTGSGNGLEYVNASQLFVAKNIWAGWNDEHGFVVTHAISGKFWNCSVDENNGYGPAGLSDAARGDTKKAFYVKSQALGQNNDTNFINCTVNGAGAAANYAVQIGDPGLTPVESVTWDGGLIQASFRGVYVASGKDVDVLNTHIEPPTGAQPDYLVRIEDSINCSVKGRNIQGDVLVRNSELVSLANVRVFGINIEADAAYTQVKRVVYGNSSVGPTGGKLIDQSMTSSITEVLNAANANYSVGDNLGREKNKFISSNMNNFVINSGTPVVPCGFELIAGTALTKVTSPNYLSSHAAQVNHTTEFTEGFKIRLSPIGSLRGRRVLVDALLYNQLVAQGGYIFMETFGGTTPVKVGQESFQINAAERIKATFTVPFDATAVDLIFTGIPGARVNWLNIDVAVEGWAPVTEAEPTSATTAKPDISFNDLSERGGPPLQTVILGAGSNITDFSNPHVGVPFVSRFTAGRTVVDSAKIQLAGGVNFVATADDLLTLVYGNDGVFRELSRSLN